jgi:hypothetical protein
MFGNLAAFVNGNMFMGLFGSAVGVKLPEEDRARLLAEPGAGPFGPGERPMGGYVTLPAGWRAEQAALWVEHALAHVATLPAKAPKARAKKDRAPAGSGPASTSRPPHRCGRPHRSGAP